MKRFPSYKQLDEKDCGPACLKIILKYYGKYVALDKLHELCETQRHGTTLLSLSMAAESLGFQATGLKIDYESLKDDLVLPCIVFWQQKHFVVVYKVSQNKVFVSDPAYGLITYIKEEFLNNWLTDESGGTGIALMLQPTSDFEKEDEESERRISISYIWNHLKRHKGLISQLFFSLLAGTLIQFAFPLLAQSLVDHGIQDQNLSFVYMVLLAQLMLFLGKLFLEVIRTYIIIHIGTRLQITLLSEFFLKLMRLPVSFFDSKVTGDIVQRISDHKKIEGFITVTSLNGLFSIINLIVFSAILLLYNSLIFFIFLVGSCLFFAWILMFQKKKREYDYKLFSQLCDEQNKVLEIIQGMQEIKINNAEREKRWSWQHIQAKIFRSELKTLSIDQFQAVGASFINELKNILITIIAAKLVMDGEITLGMMLSVSYILGQLNSPLHQMIEFFSLGQKAKISLERLLEIQNRPDEYSNSISNEKEFEVNADIALSNVSFYYTKAHKVLSNIDLLIPGNKVTAIVGPSGSGKTTLLKLLLKIHDPVEGEIKIGKSNLKNVELQRWRNECGVVMQEGFIFNDTVANNITIGQGTIDSKRLKQALKIANIDAFIETLPLGINTMLGSEGLDLSVGQKQRILIARAVYKNPQILLFDEATSSLDANNEKIIMSNLKEFFENRTVIIIAHRLSTVMNADQIVVLDGGEIREVGNHESLLRSRGQYYGLIKNQLQLERIGTYEDLNVK